jgi:hypothetical protein
MQQSEGGGREFLGPGEGSCLGQPEAGRMQRQQKAKQIKVGSLKAKMCAVLTFRQQLLSFASLPFSN